MPRFNGDTSISSSIDKHWNIRNQAMKNIAVSQREKRNKFNLLLMFCRMRWPSNPFVQGDKTAQGKGGNLQEGLPTGGGGGGLKGRLVNMGTTIGGDVLAEWGIGHGRG